MPWGDTDYTSASTLKTALGITDSNDDTRLAAIVTAVSRTIDLFTNRQFGIVASAEARVYDPKSDGQSRVPIDDLANTTNLVVVRAAKPGDTFDVTLTIDDDFELLPLNAAAMGVPYTGLHFFTRPAGSPRYKVTGNYGWTTVPTAIAEAAFLQSLRLFKRKDAPFGVTGSPELGSELRLLERLDPDVAVLIRRYIRPAGAF